jgi:hypothetical protein
VVLSTLYTSWDGRGADKCADGDCVWQPMHDSGAITALGDAVFGLAVGAAFLISYDSYIDAKVK